MLNVTFIMPPVPESTDDNIFKRIKILCLDHLSGLAIAFLLSGIK